MDVVIPFWGDFSHLREAVDSVRAQTSDDWRLLVLDDVYPDPEPGEWVRALGDPRITYRRNEVNLGPSRNYSQGVKLVDGEFVVIMGCDDRMLPGYLARVESLLSRYPDADIIQPGVAVINELGDAATSLADSVKRRIMPRGPGPQAFTGEALGVSLLRGNWTYFPSLVWRRSWLENGFRTDLDVVQDLAKIMEIVIAGGTLVLDDTVVFEYRRHSQSLSSRTTVDGSKYAQERVLFAETAATAREIGWRRAHRAATFHWTSRLSAAAAIPTAIIHRHWRGARSLIRHAVGPTRA